MDTQSNAPQETNIPTPTADAAPSTQLPEGFQSLIRRASLMRFRQHCAFDAIEISEAEDPKSLVFAHWMGLILVASSSVRIILKTHYNSSEITAIAKEIIGLDANQAAIADFMREYCNLMGGVIKAAIENSGVPAGLSLPLVTRGFDQVFSAQKKIETGNYVDHWTLTSDAGKVTCSVQMEVLNTEALEKIMLIKEEAEVEEEGGVEFL